MDVTEQFYAFADRFCRAGWVEQQLMLLYMIYSGGEGRGLIGLVAVSLLALIGMISRYSNNEVFVVYAFLAGMTFAALLFVLAWLAGRRRK